MIEPLNLTIAQGETFELKTQLFQNQKRLLFSVSSSSPLDITNIDFLGQIKENYTTEEISGTFTIVKEVPMESGSISINLYPSDTLPLNLRTYVYDIIMVDNNSSPATISRIAEGQITVRPLVTTINLT